jgi:Tfp pilus assembly protein PilO
MRKIFDLLDDKEKKTLVVLCIMIAAVVLFLLLISLSQRKSYFSALSSQTAKQRGYDELNKTKIEKEGEWIRWQEARRDMDELEKTYFYDDDKEGFERLRLDLEQLLSKARINVSSRKKYDYVEFKGETIKKVNITFDIKGSYLSLKRFINSVEEFPKFLLIEKVDFLNIDAGGNVLELRIVLAGYYES